jgi:ferrous iron transport protein B
VRTGLILKATLLRGEASPFVLELPPYHLPTPRTVLLQAWQRLREFVFRAGQVIVPVVTILSFFNAVGVDGTFGKQNTRESVLAVVSQSITPIFHPIGVTNENWPAAVGLFTGIFAKEAVVGTLNSLYAQAGAEDAAAHASAAGAQPVEATKPAFTEKLAEAVATVPAKFSKIAEALSDPLGLNVAYTGDAAEAATELKVEGGVFGAMTSRFAGTAGAFAYLLLILLYTPCVAALGAIRHEAGLGWTAFAAGWTTLLGYVSAVAFYQGATFTQDPATASFWLIGCAATIVTAIGLMFVAGQVQSRRLAAAMAAE